jgi:hypothetical protein
MRSISSAIMAAACSSGWTPPGSSTSGRIRPPVSSNSCRCRAAFELNVDASIVEAPRWKIVLRHLPFKHVDALWNGSEPHVIQPTNWY